MIHFGVVFMKIFENQSFDWSNVPFSIHQFDFTTSRIEMGSRLLTKIGKLACRFSAFIYPNVFRVWYTSLDPRQNRGCKNGVTRLLPSMTSIRACLQAAAVLRLSGTTHTNRLSVSTATKRNVIS